MLETESHGVIESGFFATFTQFARLGEYTLATRHLCELVQHLAEHPDIREAKILGYDLDKFWQREGDHTQEIMQMVREAEQSYLPELHCDEMERQLEREQGEVPLEDEIDLHDEGRMIPAKVGNDGSSITIGKYRISALHFGRMAVYLARGGIMGWMNEQKPEFAEPTLQAIKESRNPLYTQAQQELNSRPPSTK